MRWDLAFIASLNFQNYNYAEFCRNRYQPLYRSTRSSVLLRIQTGFGRGEEWKENQSLDMVHISTTPMFGAQQSSALLWNCWQRRGTTLFRASCMTMFDFLSPNDIFGEVLDSFYKSERCMLTLRVMQHGWKEVTELKKKRLWTTSTQPRSVRV